MKFNENASSNLTTTVTALSFIPFAARQQIVLMIVVVALHKQPRELQLQLAAVSCTHVSADNKGASCAIANRPCDKIKFTLRL